MHIPGGVWLYTAMVVCVHGVPVQILAVFTEFVCSLGVPHNGSAVPGLTTKAAAIGAGAVVANPPGAQAANVPGLLCLSLCRALIC
jgi:hypothetical protein